MAITGNKVKFYASKTAAQAVALKDTEPGSICFTDSGIILNGNVYAEPNTIEEVKVNGSVLTPSDYAVNITAVTGTSNGTIAVNGSDVAVKGYSDLAANVKSIQDALYSASMSATYNGFRGATGTVTLSSSLKFGNDTITGYTVKYYTDSSKTNEIKSGDSITMSNASQVLYCTITYSGMTWSKSATIYAYYPIKYGFTSYSNSTFGYEQSVNYGSTGTSTSRRAYSITSTVANEYWFIAVPTGVTTPSSDTAFSMGGAPVGMHAHVSTTINGISYTVYYTNAIYASGVALSITVS